MGEIDYVEEGELTSPKSFNSFQEALFYLRRIQTEVDETYCIVSKDDGLFEVVPFIKGLQLINYSGYQLIFAY